MIKVKGLNVKYEGVKDYTLKDINFQVNKGELVCVLGSLNSGKTTLLRCLNGLIPKFVEAEVSGDVLIEDENINSIPLSEVSTKVGMILENPLLQLTGYGTTVEEEIAFGLENLGFPREEIKKRIDKSLILIDLQRARYQSPFEISGGQQQRLAIASILAMQPSVLLLDEPTNQLDPLGTQEVLQELKKLKAKHTIIMSTQKVDLITELADKVLLLHEGKVLVYDSPEKVLTRPRLLRKAKVKVPLIIELQEKKKIPINKITLEKNKFRRFLRRK